MTTPPYALSPNRRPMLLDLFCCAGGAAKGYQRAGWYVIGVDIAPQPRYIGDGFFQGDAITVGRELLRHFDFQAIHASPPCQAHSDLQKQSKRLYRDWIPETRALCQESGLPYIIENVEGAPLLDPVMLCGTMFPELRVLRHRLFESNVRLRAREHGPHPLVFTHDKRKAHYGWLDQNTSYVQVTGGGNCSIANARAAMGIDWMTKQELNEGAAPSLHGAPRPAARGRCCRVAEAGSMSPVEHVEEVARALYADEMPSNWPIPYDSLPVTEQEPWRGPAYCAVYALALCPVTGTVHPWLQSWCQPECRSVNGGSDPETIKRPSTSAQSRESGEV